jgi:hypothetical protein
VATEQRMPLLQFQDLVDRLGDEPAQWPAPDRANAEALLAASAPARQILEEARSLRAALTGPAITAPDGLKQRVLDAAFDGPSSTKPVSKAGAGRR